MEIDIWILRLNSLRKFYSGHILTLDNTYIYETYSKEMYHKFPNSAGGKNTPKFQRFPNDCNCK